MTEKNIPRSTPGKLILAATPIGNLEDMTYRVIREMKEADLIAAEDTRNSIRLLNHFDIHTPMTSYHEYNKIEKAHELTQLMLEGKTVVLITDAGTPGISDPGEELVRIASEAGVEVTSLPGACACITALTVSALPTRRFCFEAFLPYAKKERQAVLEELSRETRTIVLYEAPHHLAGTLQELLTALGDRRVSLCRELTKVHEEVWRTTLAEAVRAYASADTTPDGENTNPQPAAGRKTPRGEYVIVIEGRSRASVEEEKRRSWESMSVEEHLQLYIDQGQDRKEAMKSVARDRGVSKRDIYKLLLN